MSKPHNNPYNSITQTEQYEAFYEGVAQGRQENERLYVDLIRKLRADGWRVVKLEELDAFVAAGSIYSAPKGACRITEELFR